MAVDLTGFLGAFVIGLITSGAVLFGSYMGLKDYEQLPKRLFKTRNVMFYIGFGGFFAFVFQLAQDSAFVPLQAVAIGATWPAVLIGFTASQAVRDIGDAQMKEIKALIDKLSPS